MVVHLWAIVLLAAAAQVAPPDPYAKVRQLNDGRQWSELQAVSRAAADEAIKQQNWKVAAGMHYYLCRASFRRGQLDQALRAATAGRDIAVRAGDMFGAAMNSFGIVSVHLSQGSFELGAEAGRQMLEYARQAGLKTGEMSMLQSMALAQSGRQEEALSLVREVYDRAEKAGDHRIAIDALGRIGGLLREKSPSEAEPYLLEALRRSKLLYPNGLASTYERLAKLRLAQRRPAEALLFARQALAQPSEHIPPHFLHDTLARAHLDLGQRREALGELRRAIAIARSVRAHIPFADDIQMSHENTMQAIYERFAVTAAEEYKAKPDPALAMEAFVAVQENRAASLRTRAGADEVWRDRLPDEYWQLLGELRRTLSKPSDDPAVDARRRQIRTRLVEIESSLGVKQSDGGDVASLRGLQATLRSGEVLISYLLAHPYSLRWVITRKSIRLDQIPSERAVSKAVKLFGDHVKRNDPAHRQSGAELGAMLLTAIPAGQLWTIIPDDTLFTIPFGALTLPASGKYVIEKTALRFLPSAAFRERERGAPRNAFVGVADPVTNRADPRAPRNITSANAGVDLPRLPNSAQEVQRCSRHWPDRRLFVGAEASAEVIREAIRSRPAVLHLATHVYSPGPAQSPVIALGYSRTGEWTVLTDRDIAAMGAAPELVTLSGCGSGRGPLAPGSGLLGLTRSWLMAGTGAVMATLWEVPDGGGQLMEQYYQTLLGVSSSGTSRKAAYALQNAQLRSLHQTTPAVWASYFVIGAI